jgi:hypothetical protein
MRKLIIAIAAAVATVGVLSVAVLTPSADAATYPGGTSTTNYYPSLNMSTTRYPGGTSTTNYYPSLNMSTTRYPGGTSTTNYYPSLNMSSTSYSGYGYGR